MLKNRFKLEFQVAASLVLFAMLLTARESVEFAKVFSLLPILGGSIPYFILTFCFIFIFKSSGHKLSEIGLLRPRLGKNNLTSSVKFLVWVFAIILLSLVCGSIVVEVFDIFEGAVAEALARKSPLINNLPLLLVITPLMWLAVLGEELLFRGFVMNYIAKVFGRTMWGWILAILITAVLFGAAHFWQGGRGMVGAAVLGLIWGMAYYFTGRNLWPATVAHCATNTIGFISTYNS